MGTQNNSVSEYSMEQINAGGELGQNAKKWFNSQLEYWGETVVKSLILFKFNF